MNTLFSTAKYTGWTVFLFSLLLLTQPENPTVNSFDYSATPDLQVDYTKLSVEMGIQPQNLMIDGAATYQFKAKEDSIDKLSMHASDMEIQYVLVDEQEVDFQLKNNSLVIPLPFHALEGEEHSVKIRYSASPDFGLLKDRHDNVWTSMLPHAVQHWVPVADNPQNQLEPSFTISLPAEYQVWASGRRRAKEAINEDFIQYRFASDTTMPVTEMGFALGHFKSDSTTCQN